MTIMLERVKKKVKEADGENKKRGKQLKSDAKAEIRET